MVFDRMPFLILGLISLIGGIWLFRRGVITKSKEMRFGSLGLIFAGIFLVLIAFSVLLGKEIN